VGWAPLPDTPGQRQIDGCVIERGMAEQYLNCPGIRAGFEQVRGSNGKVAKSIAHQSRMLLHG
jgi:hypothetical protein